MTQLRSVTYGITQLKCYLNCVWPIARSLLGPSQRHQGMPCIRGGRWNKQGWIGKRCTVLRHARCHVHRTQTLKCHST